MSNKINKKIVRAVYNHRLGMHSISKNFPMLQATDKDMVGIYVAAY